MRLIRTWMDCARCDAPDAVLLVLLVGAVSCADQAAISTAPRWSVERFHQGAPGSSELRYSTDNVSRPLWGRSSQSDVPINPETDAFLGFEIARLEPGEDRSLPEGVRVELERNGSTIELPVERLAAASKGPFPWHRFRASLKDAPSGSATIRLLLGDHPLDATGEWVASVPRLLHRKDQGQRPNVLLLTVDTLRSEFLGCYGHPGPISPNVDALAARSTLFERAISQASWTLPSYASMLTSLYSEAHGVVHRSHKLADAFTTFPELLAAKGYATAAVVSGTFTDIDWGFAQGFDSYDDLGMVTDDNAGVSFSAEDDAEIKSSMQQAEKRITSPEVADKGIAWLREHQDQRFFLFLHFFDPHSDFVEHEGYSERFPPRPIERRMQLSREPIPVDAPKDRALHEGEIAFTDHHIGRVVAEVEALGLANDTVIVFCADHGEEFAERIKQGHGHAIFDELVHVPLILHVPGKASGRVAAPVTNTDIGPTLLELCDVSGGGLANGSSLLPWINDPGRAREDPVYSALFPHVQPNNAPDQRSPQRTYRIDEGALTLIIQSQGAQSFPFLFDSTADPLQTKNIYQERRIEADALAKRYLDEDLPTFRSRLPRVVQIGLTDDVVAQLEALGYVEHDPDEGDSGGGEGKDGE